MGVEAVALSAIAAVGRRPWLSELLFRRAEWGSPFAEERYRWPYPLYERMAADGPVRYGRPYRQWFVFGYDEVREVLRSPHTATAPVGDLLLSTRQYRRLSPGARESFARWLLVNDPPDHTRLRSAVSRAFTPRRIATYEQLVDGVVDELLAGLDTTRALDVAEEFTAQLPIRVIAELLGLPAERRAWLHQASHEIGAMLEPLNTFDPALMSQRFGELDGYLRAAIDHRRRRPGGGDLLAALTAVGGEGPALDDAEVVAMVALLLFAGHETVTGALGNALVALDRHPDQRALLRSDPSLIDNAVEELLRFDAPVQVSARQLTADLTLGGETMRAGDNVALMIGAANHDRRRWPDADALRLDRPDPQPISFGTGAHHCLGAALARMELRRSLPPLLERLDDHAVDHEHITWKQSFALRGPLRLPLVVRAGDRPGRRVTPVRS